MNNCDKVKQILERSCNYINKKTFLSSYFTSEIYFKYDIIQLKADTNCLKSINLFQSLECDRKNETETNINVIN